jgi:sugar lactone lactonase YvrE
MSATASLCAERVEAAGPLPSSLGESPVWNSTQNSLYWVDIPGKKIFSLQPESGVRTEWVLPERVACIAFGPGGGLLAGLETGLFSVPLSEIGCADEVNHAQVRKLAAPDFPLPNMRFNDGRCDRQGRFVAGTMLQDVSAARPVGALYCLDIEGNLSKPVVDSLIVPNGLSWSPCGRTMYLADSHASRCVVWAFDYNIETGEPSNRRVFADFRSHAGRPDGAAIDADGCYWICALDAGRVLRFTPQGKLDREIVVPAGRPTMCAFGGPNLDTLYITSMRPEFGANEHDGHIFVALPGVTGFPECTYQGAL